MAGYVIIWLMELFAEHSVANSNYDTKAKKLAILKIIKSLLYAVLFLAMCIIAFVSILAPSILGILLTLVVGVFAISPLIVAAFLIRRHMLNLTYEYDYFVIGGKFRIVRVVGRKKRKMFLEISMQDFQSVGKLEAEAYDRYAGAKDVKKLIAVGNIDEDKLFYAYYVKDGTKFLLHFEPSVEFMMTFKRSLPRMTIMDKSGLGITTK